MYLNTIFGDQIGTKTSEFWGTLRIFLKYLHNIQVRLTHVISHKIE